MRERSAGAARLAHRQTGLRRYVGGFVGGLISVEVTTHVCPPTTTTESNRVAFDGTCVIGSPRNSSNIGVPLLKVTLAPDPPETPPLVPGSPGPLLHAIAVSTRTVPLRSLNMFEPSSRWVAQISDSLGLRCCWLALDRRRCGSR